MSGPLDFECFFLLFLNFRLNSLLLVCFIHQQASRLRHHFCPAEAAGTKLTLTLLVAVAADAFLAFAVAEAAPQLERALSTDPDTGEANPAHFGYPG